MCFRTCFFSKNRPDFFPLIATCYLLIKLGMNTRE